MERQRQTHLCLGKKSDFSKIESNQDLKGPVQAHASLLANLSSQQCICWVFMLHPFPYPLAFCCTLLGVVVRSLKLVKRLRAQHNNVAFILSHLWAQNDEISTQILLGIFAVRAVSTNVPVLLLNHPIHSLHLDSRSEKKLPF